MKKFSVSIVAILLVFGMSGVSHALLFDRGGGLIYDNVLNITWLQDANYAQTSGYDSDGRMTWDNAVAWADQLEYQGYKDWRLPTTVDGPYVFGYDGTTTGGFDITSSEMGYMYYENLGNLGYYATDGTNPQPGWGLTNIGSSTNLQDGGYWSGTEYGSGPDGAWHFNFNTGNQYNVNKYYDLFAWAVRPGDSASPVPEPTTMLLFGAGLVGLAGFGRKKFKK